MLIKLIKYTWIPTLISMMIFYLCCLMQPSEIPPVEVDFFIPIDKIVHFLMFFGLSCATGLNYVYDKKGDIHIKKMLIGSILLPIIYGGSIELLQSHYFYPRQGDVYDFFADILGSLSAVPIILYYRKKIIKRLIKK